MADGSVTIKVDMDGSGAQAGVSKLKSLFGGLESTGQKVGSVFKSVLGANLIGSALSSGVSAITGGIREMASELNSSQKAWKTFEGNLQAFGRSSEEIKAAKTEMQDFATKTIYSASDMANTYSQLDAVGTKNVGSLVKAFGGLAASAENPAQAMKSLSTQATQMASKPKVAWMDFKIMMEQAPAGMAAVAKEMGMSTADLVKAVQDGKVKTEDFFDAMNKAGNSDAFQKMATEFKTVDQAIDGAKESLSNKLMPAFDKLNSFGIKAVNAVSDALDKINFDSLADKLGSLLDSIDVDGFISGLSNGFAQAGQMVSNFFAIFNKAGVFDYISDSIRDIVVTVQSLFEELTSDSNGFSNVVEGIANGVILVNVVIQELAAGVQFALEAFANTGAIKNAYSAFKDFTAAALDLAEKLGDIIPWDIIGAAAGHVVNAISLVISWISKLSQSISGDIWRGLVVGIGGALVAFKAFNFLKSFNPFGFFKSNATSALSGTTSTVTSIGSQIVAVIRSLGESVATMAKGIGEGIGSAFRGIGQALAMVNPVTIVALAVPILALGAAFALMGTQGQGLATILQAIGDVVVSVGTAIGTILNMAIQGLAQALVIVAPVLPTIASSFAMMSPVILAVGAAVSSIISSFSGLAPVITALGSAISQVVTSISSGIAQVATAITPIVGIISDTFVQVVSIVTEAVVQIVQAVAPFVPAITEMVTSTAPIIQSLIESFNNLVNQISPIIDSLTNLIKTFGEQVKSILDSAKGVVESFGSVIRSVLDGVAGIFESMGNAAKNAGAGVKLMAQGIKMLVDLNLGDLVGTLTATAVGLAAIANSGIATAGSGLQQAGTGLMMIATSAQVASVAMQGLPTVLSTLSTSINQLPSALTAAGTAMSTFATSAVASFSGLSGAVSGIAVLQSALVGLSSALVATMSATSAMTSGFTAVTGVISSLGGVLGTIPSLFSAISASAMTANTSIMQLATSAPTVASSFANISSSAVSAMSQLNSVIRSAMTQAVSQMSSSMQQMTNVVRQSATQMTQAGQQAGRGVSTGITNGIRSGIGSATSAMSSMVNSIQSAGMRGVSTMQYVGSMIGQGLANGLYSALWTVTAAANALVAQAERAARAKARIHSPSRLFRDNVGRYIAQGIAVGIEKNTSDVTDSLAYVQKEMSAFKFGAEDLLGLGNNTLSQSLKMSLGLAQAQSEKAESGTNAEINNQYTFNYNGNKVDESEKRDIQRLMKEMAWYTNREQERLGGT
jgi:putative antireceptor protein|nr:MAG TPA: tail tape measure [Caudoviricetes sp.]